MGPKWWEKCGEWKCSGGWAWENAERQAGWVCSESGHPYLSPVPLHH